MSRKENGGSCGIRTHKPVKAADFKSAVYTIPPTSQRNLNIQDN